MKKKKFSFLFLLFTALLSLNANSLELSDSSQISLLTCSPGAELYTAFGHTGIRVTDFSQNFDVVFNYGTFDFAQPGFYTNFVKGKMRYMLSVDVFNDFMGEYVYEKRTVIEQQLNLTTEERKNIFRFLYQNSQPENREYFYDFFWDNCATRPRDVFEKNLNSPLQYHTESGGFAANNTLHDMLRKYVYNRAWIDFGFDLILGLPCEKIASPRDQTFLPDYLAKYFSCATINGKPFVVSTKSLLRFPEPETDIFLKPIHFTIFLFLLGLVAFYIEKRKQQHFWRFDFIVFFVSGLFGVFFLSLWCFTSHYSVPKNLNMLWLLPSHIAVSFFLLKKQKPSWLKFYFLFTAGFMLLLFIVWPWNPQPYNLAVAPLVLLLAFRAFSIYRSFMKK